MSRSWVEVSPDSHFPIQNIPFGVFYPKKEAAVAAAVPRCGTAIGDQVLDLSKLYEAGLFSDSGLTSNVFAHASLNKFLEYNRAVWRNTRERIIALLDAEGDSALRANQTLCDEAFYHMSDVQLVLPFEVKEYTDFYASREHATNVGIMFRGKDNALQPNWLHLPVGYHGRASSVVVSGTEVTRPSGQVQKDATNPALGSNFSPCRLLDFELEMGVVLGGSANPLGSPLTLRQAEERIFGLVILNDWSARDIQAWEYVPLGPFTAKNFATSISPWVVTLDALEPFRCSSSQGALQDDPVPLPYLLDKDYGRGFYNVDLFVHLLGHGHENQSEAERQEALSLISKSNSKYLYWNIKQQVTHHSITGASMRPGDLLGTGTISGPDTSSYGSLLELTWRGAHELELKDGQKRKFLQDGDTVVMTGFAQGEGYRVGFGEVSGKILPAKTFHFDEEEK
eukprot:gene11449-12803_t